MKSRLILSYLLLSLTPCMAGPYHPSIQYVFPLPDSELLPPQTTIVLRLEQDCHDRIAQVDGLIHVRDGRGPVAGRTFVATDERTIIFEPDRDFDEGDTVEVAIKTGLYGETDFEYVFHIVRSRAQSPPRWMTEDSQPLAGAILAVGELRHGCAPDLQPVWR